MQEQQGSGPSDPEGVSSSEVPQSSHAHQSGGETTNTLPSAPTPGVGEAAHTAENFNDMDLADAVAFARLKEEERTAIGEHPEAGDTEL